MASQDEDLEDFLREVDDVSKILKNLNSTDPTLRDKAVEDADIKLNECGKVKYDRTVINHAAFKNDSPGPPGMLLPDLPPDDPRTTECFMAQLEKDVEMRAKRRARNEIEAKLFREEAHGKLKKRNYQEAINLYTEAIRLIRDHLDTYINRAEAYMKCHMYKEAIKDCETISLLHENNFQGISIKAQALFKLEEFDESITCFEKAMKIYPLEKRRMSEWIDTVRDVQDMRVKEERTLNLLKEGNKNLKAIDDVMKEFEAPNMSDIVFTQNCLQLMKLITTDDDKVFFRARFGFKLIIQYPTFAKLLQIKNGNLNPFDLQLWECVVDLLEVVCKENEDNQKILFNFGNFVIQLQNVLTTPLIFKTVSFLHTLSCEDTGRRVIVNRVNNEWLLKTLMENSRGESSMSISILNNLALDENFRDKLELSFENILLPEFRILLTGRVNKTLLTYFGNLALKDCFRAKMCQEKCFWNNSISYLENFNKCYTNYDVANINSLLGLILNITKSGFPECTKPCIKPLIEQLISCLHIEGLQTERIYQLLSRIVNSFDGAVKTILNLNLMPNLLQLIEKEQQPLTSQAVRILVSVTRISKKSQKQVVKMCPNLLALLKSNDETTVGNTALCLSQCLDVPKFSNYLTQTDVVNILLNIIKKENLKDDVKKNAAVFLAKLTKADLEHLKKVREMRGVEILVANLNAKTI